MLYIITVIISLIIGFILGACLVTNLAAQVEFVLIRDVRSEALRCGNGMIQYGMLKTLKMLKLEEDDENNL
jgi:hypothetical protein